MEHHLGKNTGSHGPEGGIPAEQQIVLGRPGPEIEALSLLDDESSAVRAGVAEYLCLNAQCFESIPADVLRQIFIEPDSQAVSSLVSFLAMANDPEGVAAPVCIRLLSDRRPGVAVDAATALGDIAQRDSAAVVPMAVMVDCALSINDPRARAFRGGFAPSQPRDIEAEAAVQDSMQLSERAHLRALKELCVSCEHGWTDAQVNTLTAGLCSFDSKGRRLALKILTAFAEKLTPAQRGKTWSALAFVMEKYEREPPGEQLRYLAAVRAAEMPAALSPMIESFLCEERSNMSMARDFTAVFLAREGRPLEPINRLSTMLWSVPAGESGAAASNLIVLANLCATSPDMAWIMVRSALDAYLERAGEGPVIMRAFQRAFSLLDGLHRQVIEYCKTAALSRRSPDELHAIVGLVGVVPWCADEAGDTNDLVRLLETLSHSKYDRVADAARNLLEPKKSSLL